MRSSDHFRLMGLMAIILGSWLPGLVLADSLQVICRSEFNYRAGATPAPQRASEAVTAALAPLADRVISVSAPTVAPYEVDSGNSRGYTVCVSVTLRDVRP